ncbi:hypothetical protein F4780DRAFT_439388 [Xylariomycetidae sp. FL0641]|nr:hypothetical protein F4780DRAFT_439388 [Xylariomycetidae sp. FL0641]
MPRLPPDPRKLLPRHADPEHRSRRKQLEKEHPYSWQAPLVLGLIGVSLAWNMENQVRKHEEKKDKQQQQAAEQQRRDDRERRPRRREDRTRSEPRRERSAEWRPSERASGRSRGASRHPRDPDEYPPIRHASVDQRYDPRLQSRPRYDIRYADPSVDRYMEEEAYGDEDHREPEGSSRGRRSRRDSF